MDSRKVRQNDRWRMLAKRLYGRIPPSLRWLLHPAVFCYRVCDEIRPRFWIGESQGREDGLSISVLCVARTSNRSFLLDQFFGGQYCERCIGRAWLWHLPKVLARRGKSCCGVVVHVRPGFHRFLGRERWMKIPCRVLGQVDLPLAPYVFSSDSVKDDLRKIRKHALAFEVTRDVGQLEDFYFRMYLPHITKVYGRAAVIYPYHTVKRHLRDGELLFVSKEGRRIGGMIIHYGRARAELYVLGVLEGDRQWVRQGVIGALYHFCFQYLAQRNLARVDLGASRAFLCNGVLQYKKKMGMKIVGMARGYYYLQVLGGSPTAHTFLRENPLIIERDGSLIGVVFISAGTGLFCERDFLRLARQFFVEGLSRLLVVRLDDSVPVAAVPPEFGGRIAVCHVSDIVC